jgi:RimJ/RimL family protein N-acetyltransferase
MRLAPEQLRFSPSLQRAPEEVRTERLLLRPWRDHDLAPFARMNADPSVMEYFPAVLTRKESNALADRIREHFDEHGFGLWAVEVPDEAAFVGFVGLAYTRFSSHFTPCVDLGWRLSRDQWGKGYAREAARAAMDLGFDRLGLDEVVAFTVPSNLRSRRVMEALGMRRDAAGDFDHPNVPKGHRFRRHVLYRATSSLE